MTKYFTDQMNQSVRLEEFPSRIVSLVPSQTELLHALGLQDQVVGITKFCIYPDDWYRNKRRVGGTKQLNIEIIRSLKPDLIIGNKEENTESDIIELKKIAPVWMSDINSFEDALEMIKNVGELTNKEALANQLILDIQYNFQRLRKPEVNKSVLYFIWHEPNFVAGKLTFIDAIIDKIGLKNFCLESRYPEWKNSDNPDFIFLSSEPFPFNSQHHDYFQRWFPNSKIILVDGEFFSWYGSRLKLAPEYFEKLLGQLSN